MKSIWKKKIYTLHYYKLLNFNGLQNLNIERKNFKKSQLSFKVYNRFINLELNLKFINLKINIYNGKFFYTVYLKDNLNLKNSKYGSLSFTRKLGLIHNKKKKNKKLKKNK